MIERPAQSSRTETSKGGSPPSGLAPTKSHLSRGLIVTPARRRNRRTPGEGGLRQRSEGSWEIKFDAGRDPATGRRLTRFVTVRGTKRDALAELGRLRDQADQGTLLDPNKLTVAEYLEQWLADVRPRVSAKTHEDYSDTIRKHLVPALGADSGASRPSIPR